MILQSFSQSLEFMKSFSLILNIFETHKIENLVDLIFKNIFYWLDVQKNPKILRSALPIPIQSQCPALDIYKSKSAQKRVNSKNLQQKTK